MKKIFKYLTTFEVGKIDVSRFTIILCLLVINAVVANYVSTEVRAADGPRTWDSMDSYILTSPYIKQHRTFFQGTTFAGETIISFVCGESAVQQPFDRFEFGYEYSADDWYTGTAYTYENLVYDSNSKRETFYMTFPYTTSFTGGGWYVIGIDYDGYLVE